MGVFEGIGPEGHEEVLFGNDPESGLRTIIAIHSTALGPALGGTRFFPYGSEEDALLDVLRLAQAMSYKAAAAGLDLGGGKAVIIGEPSTDKSERLLRAYGRTVDSLGGRYITAEDVGTTTEDMVTISRETQWVSGMPEELGGSGDPSPATARGVVAAMRAVAAHRWGEPDVAGRHVAVQGVGKVGIELVELLTKAGARITATDIDPEACDRARLEHGAEIVGVDEIYDVECDVFAPCALGRSLTARTIPRLRCGAVVGSANNQLGSPADADLLAERNMTYAPDFVANAGGIINISSEAGGYSRARAFRAIEAIYGNTERVLDTARQRSINTHDAAVIVARARISSIGDLSRRRRRSGHQEIGHRQGANS